jgi:drug/metabolite transporter (DMT)-like permease
MKASGIQIVPLLMIVTGGVAYHLSQKATPKTADPFLALCISFGLASLACLLLFLARSGLSTAQFHGLNWTCLSLAVALVAIESGYLIGYRIGLALNITSFVCNSLVAVVLLLVGTFNYREAITLRIGSGLILCVIGLIVLLR